MKTTTAKMVDALEQFVKDVWHSGNRFRWEMRVRAIINEAKANEAGSTTHLTETDMMPEGSPNVRRIIYLGMTKDGFPLAAFGAEGPLLHKWLAENEGSTHQIVILNEE